MVAGAVGPTDSHGDWAAATLGPAVIANHKARCAVDVSRVIEQFLAPGRATGITFRMSRAPSRSVARRLHSDVMPSVVSHSQRTDPPCCQDSPE